MDESRNPPVAKMAKCYLILKELILAPYGQSSYPLDVPMPCPNPYPKVDRATTPSWDFQCLMHTDIVWYMFWCSSNSVAFPPALGICFELLGTACMFFYDTSEFLICYDKIHSLSAVRQ